MFDWLSDPQAWISLLTLSVLEIVLGIDNIIFISILAGKLPPAEQPRARSLGLAGAFVSRILLLLSITWVMQLTRPLFGLLGREFSGRDLILLLGGLFLIGKATLEIHHKLEGPDEHTEQAAKARNTLWATVAQIMVLANVVALAVMLFAAGSISAFVDKHPTVKMLALAFLVLIGTNLVAEGLGQHIPKGYTYFAMAFSVAVEMLNIRVRRRA